MKIISFLLLFAAVFTLAACGAKAAPQAAPAAAADSGMWAEEEYELAEAPMAAAPVPNPSAAMVNGSVAAEEKAGGVQAQDMSEKIIYTADVQMETTEFDTVLEAVRALISELGGYLESSSIYGGNYESMARGYNSTRSASYTIRIPSENFSSLTGRLSEIGYVSFTNTYSTNVTREYYDIESRLNAYRVQEARLLEMLAIAESVEDMLSIQEHLTEVQYEIDSLTGSLRYYDNRVSFSTVNLNIVEVMEYTPEPVIRLSYAQKLVRNLRDSLRGIGRFFSNLGLWLIAALPVLLVIAALALILFFLVRRVRRRAKVRRNARNAVFETKNDDKTDQ